MKLRTEVRLEEHDFKIEHHNKIAAFGSCFAENISRYFRKYKFDVLENPFGVLFNPASIYNSLKLTFAEKQFDERNLIHFQEEWHSFDHHSDFSHHDAGIVLSKINSTFAETNVFLKEADFIIISLGTSYVFKNINENRIVSNCHKIPQKYFYRYRLSIQETISYLTGISDLLTSINPNVRIILTVSPVRHWKDGAVENQLSKAVLLLAVNEVIQLKSSFTYFPSYEIVLDELRDYRFFAEDMIHPNSIAVEYIWEKFSFSFLSSQCREVIKETGKIAEARNHKIRNPGSPANKRFISSVLENINSLKKKFPYIDFEEELRYFNSI